MIWKLRNPSMGSSKNLDYGISNFIKWSSRLVPEVNLVNDLYISYNLREQVYIMVLYVNEVLLANNDTYLLHEPRDF